MASAVLVGGCPRSLAAAAGSGSSGCIASSSSSSLRGERISGLCYRVRASRALAQRPLVVEATAASRRELVASSVLAVAAAVAAALPFAQRRDALGAAYRQYSDRFDGYLFNYPVGWIQVRGAGADVFFRDPVNLDENLLVDISSPSSSRYKGVEDLGSPEQAAQKLLKQYLTEFMSTRIGVRRESSIVSTASRVGDDGRLYYDIEVNVKSFANTNELAVMPEDRVAKLEWTRRYLSVIGVENNRLYQLRLQVPERVLAEEEAGLHQVMESFQLVKLA